MTLRLSPITSLLPIPLPTYTSLPTTTIPSSPHPSPHSLLSPHKAHDTRPHPHPLPPTPLPPPSLPFSHTRFMTPDQAKKLITDTDKDGESLSLFNNETRP